MIPVLVSGAGVGAGVWLIWRAVTAKPTLIDIEASMARRGRPVGVAQGGWARADAEHRVAAWAVRRLRRVGVDPSAHAEDLAVTETTVEQHVLAKLGSALVGFVSVAVLAAVLAAAGIPIVAGAGVVLAALFAAAGFVLPDLALTDRAKEARRGFRHAFGAYLDLVELMVAAGAGPESALADAAEAGEGPAFDAIRATLAEAKRSRSSMWQALGELGQRLGITELGQLAASATLVDSEGARIRESLAAQADSLRAAQLAEVEAEAESATERMTLPVLVLLGAFIVFIGYPAVAAIADLGP
jgi:Flp pilus assembly protein TadB